MQGAVCSVEALRKTKTRADVAPVQDAALACAWPPREDAGLVERWLLRGARPFPGLPDSAFEQPIFVARPGPGARLTQVNAVGERRPLAITGPSARFILLNDPAGVKRVLVDRVSNYPKSAFERQALITLFGAGLLGADGEDWRSHRRIMAPAFHPGNIAGHALAMAGVSEAFRRRWDACAGQAVDVCEEMSLLAFQLITQTMFSCEMREADRFAEQTSAPGRQDNARHLGKSLRAFVDALVAARRVRNSGDSNDLLDRLIGARTQDGDRLTDREIRDELITVLVAGSETTAGAMAWVWYLLSQHPLQADLLHQELRVLLGGLSPRAEDLPNLVYTRQVIEETLRLYPPATGLATRVCLEEDEMCGVRIPAGAHVAIVPFVLHRHCRLWERPGRFDPERFSPEQRTKHRFSFLPFGAGPRICIGHTLAINQLVIALATLAQSHRLHLEPGARVRFVQGITLRPRGLRMIIGRRADGF